MCGIAGELRRDGAARPGRARAHERGARAARALTGTGAVVPRTAPALAHRRLAIIDLSERGAQPMVDDELGLTVVFNGIIYNHRELRAELEGAGMRFRSDSDTEVLLKGWAEWGEGLLDRLAGMFAFCLVEHASGRCVLARDRLGMKPLYLQELRDGGLRIASSLPALVAGGGVDTRVDPVALHHYLSFHSIVPAPRTILRGVRKLPPATVLIVEPDGQRRERRYWDPPFERDPARADWSAEDWEDGGHGRAAGGGAAAHGRRRAGRDPAVGRARLEPDRRAARRAGPDAGWRRSRSASRTSASARATSSSSPTSWPREFGTDHHQIRVGPERLLPALPRAIAAMSEPMVSHDAVAFFLLSEEVSKERKVVQSGQGADEVFGGYYWYPPLLEADGDGLDVYADAFFDRDDAGVRALLAESWAAEGDPSRALAATWFAARGRGERDRPRAAARRRGDARRRPGQARRQHDDGARAGGAHAVPRPRAGRAGGAVPAGAQARRRRQGRAEARRARGRARRGDRPAEGLLPRPGAVAPRRAGARAGRRRAALRRGPDARAVPRRTWSRRCSRDPNEHRTNLDGSTLWQLGLLELWLQTHVN